MNKDTKGWKKRARSFYQIRNHVLVLLAVSLVLISVVSPVQAATFEVSQKYGKFLDAGNEHSLALKSDGTVVAWGSNDYGQTNVPEGLDNVVAIDAGGNHSLALKSDGTVVAWGINDRQTNIPADLRDVVAIAAGDYHSVALKSDGTVVVIGYRSYGELRVPSGLNNVVAIDAGYAHILALKSDGTVVAWGYNDRGQTNVPEGLTDVVAIDAGDYHSVALKSDGTVVSWGSHYSGQTNIPEGLTDVVAVDAGDYYSLALKSDGTVVAWGTTNFPMDLTGLSDVVDISAGSSHFLVLKSDSTVVARGDNYYGQTNVPFGLKVGDVTIPTATIQYSATNSTNQNVVANLNPSEPITVTNNGGSPSYTFTENGSFTFEFVDGSGNIGSAVATVSNIDKIAPTLNLSFDKPIITERNHKLIPIKAFVDAEDTLSGIDSFELISIISNQEDNGNGDGNTIQDIQGTEFGTSDTDFLVRAERSGSRDRIYKVTYKATDNAGNSVITTQNIVVKHDKPNK